MKQYCKGCEEDFGEALYEQDQKGLHLATCKDILTSYPAGNHHFFLIMVDDKGKVVIGKDWVVE